MLEFKLPVDFARFGAQLRLMAAADSSLHWHILPQPPSALRNCPEHFQRTWTHLWSAGKEGMEKKWLYYSSLGLYGDNGKENGDYYKGLYGV